MARCGVILSGLLAVGAIAGCGYSRAPAPSLGTPAPPGAFHPVSFPTVGVTLDAPGGWTRIDQVVPLVATWSSRNAVIALWRYPRSDSLPSGRPALSMAAQNLVAAVRARQPGLELIRTRIVHLGGSPGIELNALERIKGQVRRVRSSHLYADHEEIVLEEYAPVGLFHTVDHAVFSPVRRSLRISVAS